MIGNEELPSLVIYDTKLYNTLFYHVLKYCLHGDQNLKITKIYKNDKNTKPIMHTYNCFNGYFPGSPMILNDLQRRYLVSHKKANLWRLL